MDPDELDPETKLELDQYVAQTSRRVPRAALGPRARTGLWALRVFALLLGAMVVFTFISQLGQ